MELIKIVERVKPIVQAEQYTKHINYSQYSMVELPFFYNAKYITYPGVLPGKYVVNTLGEIMNAQTGCKLCQFPTNTGYLKIKLQTINGGQTILVHRLVAYEFCVPPDDITTVVVNHINGDKMDNRANNLEWLYQSQNAYHSLDIRDESRVEDKLELSSEDVHEICRLFQKKKTNAEVMQIMGIEITPGHHCLLSDIRAGRTWAHISCNYKFSKSSIAQPYSKNQIEQIKQLMLQGKDDYEIYNAMNRSPFNEKKRKDLRFKRLHSIRYSTWGYQNLPHKTHNSK